MPALRPSVVRFVEAAASAERALAPGADELEVARRVTARLQRALGKLIGLAGFEVLLARSLVLARRAHPRLSLISVASGGSLEAPADAGREPLTEGEALAIAEHFMELLVELVGEDLAMRLVRDVWPAAAEEHKR